MTMTGDEKGRLFVISGPSGAGKGTICKAVLARSAAGSRMLSISMTTREPRKGEQDGVHYYFATRESFEERIRQDGFLEYAEVFGNYYGTPRAAVEENLARGTDVILEIDVQGALKVRNAMPDAVLIFVLPPSMEVLRKRLFGRGTETEEQVALRLSRAHGELRHIDSYDYFVVNDVLEDAVQRVTAVMEAEHARVTPEIREMVRSEYEEE